MDEVSVRSLLLPAHEKKDMCNMPRHVWRPTALLVSVYACVLTGFVCLKGVKSDFSVHYRGDQ
jgi:hypothetical protein